MDNMATRYMLTGLWKSTPDNVANPRYQHRHFDSIVDARKCYHRWIKYGDYAVVMLTRKRPIDDAPKVYFEWYSPNLADDLGYK